MNTEEKIKELFSQIDEVNNQDPNSEIWNGQSHPKELIYGQRMTEMLSVYQQESSFELQVAARGQHIERWVIPRADYPMDRPGYLKWRTSLKIFHGDRLAQLLEAVEASSESINRVKDLLMKKKLKSDQETKVLEDVICLVFIQFHLEAFAASHPEAKIISIIQKTWAKMTEKGHQMALEMKHEPSILALIQKALA